jgi:predicted Fe-Mo cluster-binding NifX family protein
MKVAVVSSDEKVINRYFGHASRFLIFEVDGGEIQFIEVRETTPLCGSANYEGKDDVLCRIIYLIKDCEAVLCARIGRKPRNELRKNGINPIEAPYLIHEALKSI